VLLTVRPAELREVNAFVLEHHRHHKPVMGHRFSVKVVDELGVTRGVASVGRPVARAVNHREVLEVTRCCTDGTPNAVSMLLGAAARAGRALGYKVIQTYTLPEEGGASLRASGWEFLGEAGGGQWTGTNGKSRRNDQPTSVKHKWRRVLSP
jgi:hypothetical protein